MVNMIAEQRSHCQQWLYVYSLNWLDFVGASFDVRVDPTQLTAGKFHYGEILGYDTQCPDRGPLFCLPVSVAKPIIPSNASLRFQNINFEPGLIRRWFIAVPAGATHCGKLNGCLGLIYDLVLTIYPYFRDDNPKQSLSSHFSCSFHASCASIGSQKESKVENRL
jgi:hypothetical protein